jgi:hypothetical protein
MLLDLVMLGLLRAERDRMRRVVEEAKARTRQLPFDQDLPAVPPQDPPDRG